MINRVNYISEDEFIGISKNFEKDNSFFIAEINGSSINSLQDYFNVVNELFKFPIPSCGLDGYLDWMRDLSWLNKDGYVLIIHNFHDFLSKDIATKNKIIIDFEEAILPFWQDEVEYVVVEGKTKPFMVYFVD